MDLKNLEQMMFSTIDQCLIEHAKSIDLSKEPMNELRDIAKALKISTSRKKKAQLIAEIKEKLKN